jgi:hypothetical protein
MLQTPAWQIPYPESPDHTRTWEYWQAIAQRVDACLTQIVNPAICVATQTVAQSIPTGAWTSLSFNAESIDTANMHNPASLNTRITIPTDGKYLLAGSVCFVSNATGRRGLQWAINGVANPYGGAVMLPTLSTSTPAIPSSTLPVQLTAGQYVELQAFQDTGAALSTSVGASVQPFASAIRLSN